MWQHSYRHVGYYDTRRDMADILYHRTADIRYRLCCHIEATWPKSQQEGKVLIWLPSFDLKGDSSIDPAPSGAHLTCNSKAISLKSTCARFTLTAGPPIYVLDTPTRTSSIEEVVGYGMPPKRRMRKVRLVLTVNEVEAIQQGSRRVDRSSIKASAPDFQITDILPRATCSCLGYTLILRSLRWLL